MKHALWFAAFVCGANTLGLGAAMTSLPAGADSTDLLSVLSVFSLNLAATLLAVFELFHPSNH